MMRGEDMEGKKLPPLHRNLPHRLGPSLSSSLPFFPIYLSFLYVYVCILFSPILSLSLCPFALSPSLFALLRALSLFVHFLSLSVSHRPPLSVNLFIL